MCLGELEDEPAEPLPLLSIFKKLNGEIGDLKKQLEVHLHEIKGLKSEERGLCEGVWSSRHVIDINLFLYLCRAR